MALYHMEQLEVELLSSQWIEDRSFGRLRGQTDQESLQTYKKIHDVRDKSTDCKYSAYMLNQRKWYEKNYHKSELFCCSIKLVTALQLLPLFFLKLLPLLCWANLKLRFFNLLPLLGLRNFSSLSCSIFAARS
ncbi:hypothetical protein SELMODRAFT_431883 [Selaginella moellendorffii]|uniref:Uncharacterized protein n=1 Tax=Selaginella moellendorffii TaxID=88036 RepID=D8TE33_SELML|nr:hypothetical protein SELMODRAFT_431883 [Selaginella moellendorffii]